MEGNRNALGCEGEVKLCALCVECGDGILIVEDGLHDVVCALVGHVCGADEGRLYGDGLSVNVKTVVGACGDGVGCVVGAILEQLLHMLVIDGDKVYILCGCEGRNCGSRCAGAEERCVNLAVLHALGGGVEGLVYGVDVIESHAVSSKNVDGVVVGAGALVTDADGLALEVGNALDAGVDGHDLNGLCIQCAQNTEVVELSAFGKAVGTFKGVGHNVGLDGSKLVNCAHALKVCTGAAGGDCGHGDAEVLADYLAEDTAKCVIGSCGAAGTHGEALGAVDRLLVGIALDCVVKTASVAGAGAQCEYHHNRQKHGNYSFHVIILL